MQKEIAHISKKDSKTEKKEEKRSILEDMRKQYLKKGVQANKRRKGDEKDILSQLESFRKKITVVEAEPEQEEKEQVRCKLHGVAGCQSCFDTFGKEEGGTDEGWLGHALVFKKDANVYEPKVDDYVLIDPRAEAKGYFISLTPRLTSLVKAKSTSLKEKDRKQQDNYVAHNEILVLINRKINTKINEYQND